MTTPEASKGPPSREQQASPESNSSTLYSRGTILFSLGPHYFRKDRLTPKEIEERMSQVHPVTINQQFRIIDAVSEKQRGEGTQEQVNEWIISTMPSYFERIRQMEGTDEIKRILKNNLGIDIDKKGEAKDRAAYYASTAQKLWDTYFADGKSHTAEFIKKLTTDVLWKNPSDFDERIETVRPLFYLFGGEETAILMEQAAMAYDHTAVTAVRPNVRNTYITWMVENYEKPFASEAERNAYQLAAQAWEQEQQQQDNGSKGEKQTQSQQPQEEHTQDSQQQRRTGQTGQAQESLPHMPMGQSSPERVFLPPAPTAPSSGKKKESEDNTENNEAHEETVATEVLPDPRHPDNSADRVVSKEILGGKSFVLSAIDGIGSGGTYSEEAAEIVAQQLHAVEGHLPKDHFPSIGDGKRLLMEAYYRAGTKIDRYVKGLPQNTPDDIKKQIGAVAASGILCKDHQGNEVLVTANLGDARIYLYYPKINQVLQVTQDQTPPQVQLRAGIKTPQEAFLDTERRKVNKTVTPSDAVDALLAEIGLEGKNTDVLRTTTLRPKEDAIIIAATDGLTDNMPPGIEDSLFQKAYEEATKKGEFSAKLFAETLAEWPQALWQNSTDAGLIIGSLQYRMKDFVKQDDIGIGIVLRRAD